MNKLTRYLLLCESIFSLGAGLFLPIFAIYSQEIGGDITDAGIAAGIYVLVTSTLQLPVGKYLDKFPKKWFLATDYLLEAIVFFGYAFVTNSYQLFFLQIFLGIATAVGDPAWEALFGDSIQNKNAGKLWSLYHFFSGYATAVGIFIGAFLADLYGFDSIFIIGGVFCVIAFVVTVMFVKEPNVETLKS